MKSKQLMNLLVISLITGFICCISLPAGVIATTPCGRQVGVTDNDSTCGYLDEKLDVHDNTQTYPGLWIDDDDESGYYKLWLGFDTTEVGSRTWWKGTTDFTWTFNADGNEDPTIFFEDESP